ncbi:MAG TPA: hypothetical protein IGR89_09440 [Oscillatoriaceae cyanobacterium M7585_C2015_266]|nr:hypothetical protein [Oscillatoriaceae cyanobacterium SKYGB_i_bin93]HIK28280.1 hypothetical protein [Oscillatoriaceae cyanobacterium M7585_C2015_266]
MSENVNTKPLATEELKDYIATPPPSVDAYADRLMDELFQDVEQILEKGTQLPKKTWYQEYLSLQPITVPTIVVPLTPKSTETPKPDDTQVVEAKVVAESKKNNFAQTFDRWLFGAAVISLLITFSLWLGSRAEIRKLFTPTPNPSPTAKPAKSQAKAEADAKFAKYIQTALANIEQKASARKKIEQQIQANTPPTPAIQTVQPTITLPPLPLTLNLSDATTLAQSLNRLAASLEKLNPTANTAPKTATATAATKSTTATKPTAPAKTATPSPPAAANPTPTPTVAATSAAPQKTTPSPTPTPTQAKPQPTAEATPETTTPEPTAEPTPEVSAVAPTIEPLPQISAPPAIEPPVTAVVPEMTPEMTVEKDVHKLVGVLELGERSAALFEINGAVQRVNIGESIGNSGWILVEVSKGEAIIRRNGEVRSIYVEQKF